MSDLSQYIEKDFKSGYCTQSLKTYDLHMIGASPAMFSGISTRSEFTAWNEKFQNGYNQLLETFETQGRSINVDYIRSLEVEQRWQAERFFATEGNDGAREVLGYYDIDGAKDIFAKYDDAQWETLTTSFKRPRIDANDPNSTIEGHHINDVSNNSGFTAEGYASTGGPNNVRLVSREAHVNSETYGHGGNTQNATTGDANEIDRTFNNVVDQNHSNNINELLTDGTGIAFAVAGAAFTIQAGYLLFKNRKSSKSKNQVYSEILKQGSATGATLGAGSFLYSTGYSVITDSLHSANLSDSMNAGFGEFNLGELSYSLDGDTLADLLAIGGGVGLMKFGLSAYQNLSNNGLGHQTLKNLGIESLRITKQETAWLGYGLGVDLLADLLIPDPTGITQTVVITSRVLKGLWGFATGKSNHRKDEHIAKRIKEKSLIEEKYKEKQKEILEDLKTYYYVKMEKLKESIFRELKYST